VGEAKTDPASAGAFACPKCGSPRVRGSRAKTAREWLLRAVGAHFYRCPDCRDRGWRLRRVAASDPPPRASWESPAVRRDRITIAVSAVLAALLAVCASYFLQR
jgi:predicted RNA-binding Zn-ribbon protein involved in translation (DUF1610 family)